MERVTYMNDMDAGKLKDLLGLAKELGVKKIKVDGFEAEFFDQLIPSEIELPKESLKPTDDELLYWSSGYDPKVEAEQPA